jgi:hypothetical protein
MLIQKITFYVFLGDESVSASSVRVVEDGQKSIQVIWDVMLWHCVRSSGCFKGLWCLQNIRNYLTNDMG